MNTIQEKYDIYKQQKETDKKAVTCIQNEMHYPNILPENFIFPPLNITISRTNKFWSKMMECINDKIKSVEEVGDER